jgi:hypothetical protein
VASLAATEWEVNPTYWLEVEGEWQLKPTFRGFWQGRRLAMTMFCLSLAESLGDPQLDLRGAGLAAVSIQDDTYLVGRLHKFHDCYGGLVSRLQRGGHILQPTKCTIWAPSWDTVEDALMPAWAQQLFSNIPRSIGGISALGAAAQGQWETNLGPWQLMLAKATERTERAEALARNLIRYIRDSNSPHRLQVAWILTRHCIAQALVYDARLIEPGALHPLAQRVDLAVARVLTELLHNTMQLQSYAWWRLTLPGPLGGCGVRNSSISLVPAYVATWLTLRSKLSALSQAFQRRADFDDVHNICVAAVQRLEDSGVRVDDALQVSFTPTAAQAYANSPFFKDDPLPAVATNDGGEHGKGLQSRLMRVLSAVRATWLHSVSDDGQRRAMLSSGGNGAGQFWSAVPRSNKEVFENAWFRVALLQRLHIFDFPTSAVCQVRRAEAKEELCLEPLGKLHPYNCRAGPSRFRPHRALISEMAIILRSAGAHVDVERYCTDLAKYAEDGSVQEAWMDVCAQFPGSCKLWRLDVTVRSTFACYAEAATLPGAAAATGVNAKLTRYGEGVNAIAVEPLGRMAIESVDTMWQLAKEATYRGRHGAPAYLFRRWRLALERALLWSTAELALLALGAQAHARW